jgi:hypothetical protein
MPGTQTLRIAIEDASFPVSNGEVRLSADVP